MNDSIKVKSKDEIKIMQQGGEKLAKVKEELVSSVKEGVNAFEVDKLAEKLILASGGQPSFKMVPGYRWTTCVNINDGVVHGIPKKTLVFKSGDVVSLDIGIYYKSFHTDTSVTVAIEPDLKVSRMLSFGKRALQDAIGQAKVGNRIYDISKAIEKRLRKGGYSPIKALVGHGIGRDLHEGPAIPCFAAGKREDSPEIVDGSVLAIEVMYAEGSGDVVIEDDGWTIATRDGKISALFEDTVAIAKDGQNVLTSVSM